MSQTWTTDCFAGTHDGMTDLQNMENNFAALKSSFSGLSAPSSPVAFQLWGDLSDYVLKFRNADDNDWFGIFPADANQKMWFYRNSAMDGWVVDSGVSDKVLGVKGGATYITGGIDTQGNYALTAVSHIHQILDISGSVQYTYNTSGSQIAVAGYSGSGTPDFVGIDPTHVAYQEYFNEAYTSGCIWTGDEWRPYAAVGTLQYMDL